MPSRPITPRYTTYALGVLFAVNLVNQIDRNVLASLLPLIQAEYGVSDWAAGLLGSSFIWVFMLSAVPLGHLADRRSRTRIITGGLSTWSVATALSGLVPSFAWLFGCRALVGIGEAGYAAAAPSLIADYFPPRRRTRALSIFHVAFPVGAGLGFALGGVLGDVVGWRMAFVLAAVPGLVLTFLVNGLREPQRGVHDSSEETGHVPLRQALARLLTIRSYLAVVASGTLVTFAIGGVAVWLPTYLVRVYDTTLSEAGTIAGVALMLGSLLGTLSGGAFAEWLGRRTENALVHTMAISLGITALVLPVFLLVDDKTLLIPSIFLVTFFLFWHIGPMNTLISNIAPPNIRGIAVSAMILVVHLLGDAFSPALIGAASDSLRQGGMSEADALRTVLLVFLPAPVFLATIVTEVAGRWAPADMRRVVGESFFTTAPPAVVPET